MENAGWPFASAVVGIVPGFLMLASSFSELLRVELVQSPAWH